MYPQGILFDLDNTLVDWRRSIAAYAMEFRTRFSAALDEIDTPALTEVLVEADGGGCIAARLPPGRAAPALRTTGGPGLLRNGSGLSDEGLPGVELLSAECGDSPV